ncbi:MAG: peptidoglycan-associated lipoprotein Pal [bacterium]
MIPKKFILCLILTICLIVPFTNGCAKKIKAQKEGKKKLIPSQEHELSEEEKIRRRKAMEDDQKEALVGKDLELSQVPAANRYNKPTGQLAKVFRTIYFDYGRAEINKQYRLILNNIADWLKTNRTVYVMIEGHCDERGTNEYNLGLGERRALSIRSYLIRLGIASDRLHTISYGEEKPAALGHNETGWAKNRRGDFLITPVE